MVRAQEIVRKIEVLPGVEPRTDSTPLATQHYVEASKIRFVNGRPQKIGGWTTYSTDDGSALVGIARTFFSYQNLDSVYSLIGTHKRLYSLVGSQLLNITPFQDSALPITNALDTVYYDSATFGANPLESFIGSTFVKVLNLPTGHPIKVGDRILISGAIGFNGIPVGELNTVQIVTQSQANDVSFDVVTPATASGTGGGGSVTLGTRIIRINDVAHELEEGDRIKIQNATAIGGISAPEINVEHIIRNVETDKFDIIVTSDFSTSAVTGGGGSAEYFPPIPEGNISSSAGQGYGLGRYGVGRYGVPKLSTIVKKRARVWSFDRFGNNIVATPGGSTGVYLYQNDGNSPQAISGAPTEVNYLFVDNNIVVTLGADSIINRIKWSDQGDAADWTPTATNQAGEDDIEGANKFIAQANVKGVNLLFTTNQVYTFRYIGGNLVWETKLLDSDSGIISQNARIVVEGTCFWMGQNNFMYYKGGSAEVIPSVDNPTSTIRNFVYTDLNRGQGEKIFCWHNQAFNEIWWHYPSTNSDEPDSIARFNYKEFTWVADTMERTAAEYPVNLLQFHRLITDSGIIYNHEDGQDADGVAIPFSLKTRQFFMGLNTVFIRRIIPDNIMQDGDITLEVSSGKQPQSALETTTTHTIASDTGEVPIGKNGRVYQYTISGGSLGQKWEMGDWHEVIQDGGQ